MKDIKKRFIDILFEPEDEEEDLFEEQPQKKEKKPVKEAPVMNAKDILYRKSDQSAFINLEETINTARNIKNGEPAEYELSSQISPIFGVIKDGAPAVRHEVDTNEALINKPEDSHLDIITSPIYGYGSKDDMDDSEGFTDEYQTNDRELHELFDRPAADKEYVAPEPEEDDGEYLDYSLRRDEDEDDITLFDLYGEDE